MKHTYTVDELSTNIETQKHIRYVQELLTHMVYELELRKIKHDSSKLEIPEVNTFTEFTPKLASVTYGSDEYKSYLQKMSTALAHHYYTNRHHPEHFKDGISEMTLIDVLEMLCDWVAATKRHNDGNIQDSLRINKKRFNIDDQLISILQNTVAAYF